MKSCLRPYSSGIISDMLERYYLGMQPSGLNEEFHKLMGLISANQISLMGTIMGEESTEMTEEEQAYYLGRLENMKADDADINPYARMTLEQIDASLDDDTKAVFIDQAKGEAAMERRMTFGASLLVKLEEFMPFVQGTASFREYIPREFKRAIRNGISEGGKDHWLYGDKLGGIFHPVSVEAIEEKSLQIFAADIAWYGKDPMMMVGTIFEADYDNDPVYREMVDSGRRWKLDFVEKYKRVLLDVRGQEIQIP